jgi:phosphatidylserine/phosphatidylglycerophosphate/cardiolipin synthase-like enzyme
VKLEALHQLPTASLRSLADSLAAGMLSAGITRFGVQQVAGTDTPEIERVLQTLAAAGFSPAQMAVVVSTIVDSRAARPDATALFDLVLSGPDLPGVPTADTAAVVQTLIAQAKEEIVLVGYAFHNGQQLFRPLAERMEGLPNLSVIFCLEIARPYLDKEPSDEIVRRFMSNFRSKHWPWMVVPRVFFDPRSLIPGATQRSCLHAKCIVVDRSIALVTSANFTEAAHFRNIEAGVLVRHQPTVERLVNYIEGLRQGQHLQEASLAW